jgi:hypothetical protein
MYILMDIFRQHIKSNRMHLNVSVNHRILLYLHLIGLFICQSLVCHSQAGSPAGQVNFRNEEIWLSEVRIDFTGKNQVILRDNQSVNIAFETRRGDIYIRKDSTLKVMSMKTDKRMWLHGIYPSIDGGFFVAGAIENGMNGKGGFRDVDAFIVKIDKLQQNTVESFGNNGSLIIDDDGYAESIDYVYEHDGQVFFVLTTMKSMGKDRLSIIQAPTPWLGKPVKVARLGGEGNFTTEQQLFANGKLYFGMNIYNPEDFTKVDRKYGVDAKIVSIAQSEIRFGSSNHFSDSIMLGAKPQGFRISKLIAANENLLAGTKEWASPVTNWNVLKLNGELKPDAGFGSQGSLFQKDAATSNYVEFTADGTYLYIMEFTPTDNNEHILSVTKTPLGKTGKEKETRQPISIRISHAGYPVSDTITIQNGMLYFLAEDTGKIYLHSVDLLNGAHAIQEKGRT